MSETIRWRPPLPSLGRNGPTVVMSRTYDVTTKLQTYVLGVDTCASFFEKRVSRGQLHRLRIRFRGDDPDARRFQNLTPDECCAVILDNIYPRMSRHFSTILARRPVPTIRNWFQTLDGILFPCILYGLDNEFGLIDRITKSCLERMSQNYCLFLKQIKTVRKAFRIWFLEKEERRTGDLKFPGPSYGFTSILDLWKKILQPLRQNKKEFIRAVLTLGQTRGTGLVDAQTLKDALTKFVKTITTPPEETPVEIDTAALLRLGPLFTRADPSRAKLSGGPASCFEKTRSEGGQTAAYIEACKGTIDYHYDIQLRRTAMISHRVADAEDLFSWSIERLRFYPESSLAVRAVVVNEPSKARVVTAASLPYLILMGIMGHIFQPTIWTERTASGLKRTRHLWSFLKDTLHTEGTAWERLEGRIFALSTDLEECTDFGSLKLSRAVMDVMVGTCPEVLRPLVKFASRIYNSPRPVHLANGTVVTKLRGWFMGDPFTKFMLSAVQEYVYQRMSLRWGKQFVTSVVGDDLVVLSGNKPLLEDYLTQYTTAGFKISQGDTMISDQVMYYCEECSLIPQKASEALTVTLKRGSGNFVYLDYPRFRLLIPAHADVDRFSYTDTGRVELLNKEFSWVVKWKTGAEQIFERAVLLQRCTVPRSSETIHPFLPVWMGGDGSYHQDPEFVFKYIKTHSWNVPEFAFRLTQFLDGTASVAYTRTERSGHAVHRYHNIMALAEIDDLVPKNLRFYPPPEEREMWLAFKGTHILTPPEAAFKFLKAKYWSEILEGRIPEETQIEKHHPCMGDASPELTIPMVTKLLGRFLDRKPPLEDWPWLVNMADALVEDYLTLPWERAKPDPGEEWRLYTEGLLDLQSSGITEIYRSLVRGVFDIPQGILNRLNMFFSSDPLIIYQLRVNPPEEETISLISRDFKLGLKIQAMFPQKRILLCDPVLFLLGMMPQETDNTRIVEDSGAIFWADVNIFQDGAPRPQWDDMVESVYLGILAQRRRPEPSHPNPNQRVGIYFAYTQPKRR